MINLKKVVKASSSSLSFLLKENNVSLIVRNLPEVDLDFTNTRKLFTKTLRTIIENNNYPVCRITVTGYRLFNEGQWKIIFSSNTYIPDEKSIDKLSSLCNPLGVLLDISVINNGISYNYYIPYAKRVGSP